MALLYFAIRKKILAWWSTEANKAQILETAQKIQSIEVCVCVSSCSLLFTVAFLSTGKEISKKIFSGKIQFWNCLFPLKM